MKAPLSLSTLLNAPFSRHSTHLFSTILSPPPPSIPPQKPQWNSNTTFTISHPTLLLIESCNSMTQLKQIQAHMTRTGLISHLFPISRVLTFCALAQTGDIHHAHIIFSQINQPNVYIWNTMIRGYSKAGFPDLGFSLFRKMVAEGVEMDQRSFVFVLKACEVLGGVKVGDSIYCRIKKVGFEKEMILRNGLIHFYGESGCLDCARKVFDESLERDVVSWTTMIDGCVKSNAFDEGLKLFDSMLTSGIKPNEVTIIAVLSACSQKGDLRVGKSIHEYLKKNDIKYTANLTNALMDMYIKCDCLSSAREIFDEMETKDVFSWTSMINGYAKNEDLDFARKLFDEMPDRNVVSWNAMIAGYSQNNHPKEALELFNKMEKTGLVPIESTLVCVLSACSQSGCLDEGLRIYRHYIKQKKVRLSVIIANAFIDMFAKCGKIDLAAQIFDEMRQRDLVSWNSMIVGYASHGFAEKTLIIYDRMIIFGLKPDEITFVGLLSACSHGGFITKGRSYFEKMEKEFGIKPKVEHYACMIDLLGRIGNLEEAYGLIKKMPMEPDEAVWGALLNACRMHKNVALGKICAEKLINLNPNDSGVYMLLASICANEERWVDVRKVRSLMRENGVKKTPGRSTIEVEGVVHEFLASDESHPQSEIVYKVLYEMALLFEIEANRSVDSESYSILDSVY